MPTTTAPRKLRPTDFVIPPDIDLAMLTRGDDDVTHVLAQFEPTTAADTTVLTRLLELAKQGRLNGTAGHQDTAKLSHEFPTVKVAWISARLDGQTYSFLGIVDSAAVDEKRWVKAGRLAVEPFAHGAAVSLDLMPLDRATKGTPAVAVFDDDTIVDHGTDTAASTEGSSTTTPPATTGEIAPINGIDMSGLRKTKRAITPASDMGEVIKPHDYNQPLEDNAAARTTTTNPTMQGLVSRRRSI